MSDPAREVAHFLLKRVRRLEKNDAKNQSDNHTTQQRPGGDEDMSVRLREGRKALA